MTNATGHRLQAALNRLDDLWRDVDPEFAAKLAPGLSSDELDAVEAQVGLTFPVELRAWFGWHNGMREWGNGGLFVQNKLLTIANAVEAYEFLVEGALEITEGTSWKPEDTYWGLSWFPFMGADATFDGIDCSGDPSAAAPVFQTYKEGDPSRVSDTLAEVVEWWFELFDAGAYTQTSSGWVLDDLREGPESHVYELVRKYRWMA